MAEPKYTEAEKEQHSKVFEESIEMARKEWIENGNAYLVISYREYLELTGNRDYAKSIIGLLEEIKKLVRGKF